MEILFDVGKIVISKSVFDLACTHNIDVYSFIFRHISGDWVDLDIELEQENRKSISKNIGEIYSIFDFPGGKILLITLIEKELTCVDITLDLKDL